MTRLISVLMDLPAGHPYHLATVAALKHAIDSLGRPIAGQVEIAVMRTDVIDRATDRATDGVVIGPGSPYRDPAKAEEIIRGARETGIPLVGT